MIEVKDLILDLRRDGDVSHKFLIPSSTIKNHGMQMGKLYRLNITEVKEGDGGDGRGD